jgi:excinuclease UvrABC ATPase subunit
MSRPTLTSISGHIAANIIEQQPATERGAQGAVGKATSARSHLRTFLILFRKIPKPYNDRQSAAARKAVAG